MTCIVGVTSRDRVLIAGDSAGVAGYQLRVRADEKVFRKGEFLFGFTSSFRMGQLLRYSFTPPLHHPEIETMQYLVNTFIPELRQCLRDGGYLEIYNAREEGGTFLLGYRGELFQIEGDFQVGRPADSYAAVGCGDDIALGALHVLTEQGTASLHDMAVAALKAAQRHSAGVRAPFVVVEMETEAR